MNPQQLRDLADIRQLKARYFRRMDAQQRAAWQTSIEESWA